MAETQNEMIRLAGEAILKAIDDSDCNFGPDGTKRMCEDAARAVFALIREPSEAMVAAAEALDDQGSSTYNDPFKAASHEDVWKAMVEEILK